MKIVISFRDGKKLAFDQSTVKGFKSTDRLLYVLTNDSQNLYMYNMSTIDSVKLSVTRGSVSDYILKDL